MFNPRPPAPSHAPVPPPSQGPNVNHLELQAAEIKQNIKTLQVNIRELTSRRLSFKGSKQQKITFWNDCKRSGS